MGLMHCGVPMGQWAHLQEIKIKIYSTVQYSVQVVERAVIHNGIIVDHFMNDHSYYRLSCPAGM